MKFTQKQVDKTAARLIGLMGTVPNRFLSARAAAKYVLRRIAAAERRGYNRACGIKRGEPTIKYPLRVVRKKNGTLEWRD